MFNQCEWNELKKCDFSPLASHYSKWAEVIIIYSVGVSRMKERERISNKATMTEKNSFSLQLYPLVGKFFMTVNISPSLSTWTLRFGFLLMLWAHFFVYQLEKISIVTLTHSEGRLHNIIIIVERNENRKKSECELSTFFFAAGSPIHPSSSPNTAESSLLGGFLVLLSGS